MKYVKYSLLAIVIVIVITAWSFEPKAHTESAFLLDTYISVTVFDGRKDAAKKKRGARIGRWNRFGRRV